MSGVGRDTTQLRHPCLLGPTARIPSFPKEEGLSAYTVLRRPLQGPDLSISSEPPGVGQKTVRLLRDPRVEKDYSPTPWRSTRRTSWLLGPHTASRSKDPNSDKSPGVCRHTATPHRRLPGTPSLSRHVHEAPLPPLPPSTDEEGRDESGRRERRVSFSGEVPLPPQGPVPPSPVTLPPVVLSPRTPVLSRGQESRPSRQEGQDPHH